MTAANPVILVNGDPVNYESEVEYSITVTHGRNDIGSSPTASDAQITLYGFTEIPCDIGDTLVIEAYGEPRFTGFISDMTISHLSSTPPIGRLQIQAIGMLSRLGLAMVADAGLAADTLEGRVADILTPTGYVYTNNSDPHMEQMALDAQDGGYSALDLLQNLGTETGGTLADLPDGAILWESYSRRGYGYNPAQWHEVGGAWSTVAYVWSDIYESTEAGGAAVQLPNTAVVWQPIWRKTNSTIINSITIIYDPNGSSSYTYDDSTSIAANGLRATTITTQLHKIADVHTRASDVIRSQAWPLYQVQNAEILVHAMTDAKQAQVLGLLSGSRVEIVDMPQPAPLVDYMGVVEGWSETYTPGQHVMVLSLSDPRFSYSVAEWAQVSGTLTWATTKATVQWYNVVFPSDLVP